MPPDVDTRAAPTRALDDAPTKIPPTASHRPSSLYRRVERLLLLVVLLGIAWFVWKNGQAIREHDFTLRWPILIVAWAVAALTYVFNYLIWLRVASAFSLDAPLRTSAYAWFASQLGKYIPGKVMILLMRVSAYAGYPSRKVAAASTLEFLGSVAASSIVILLGVAFSPSFFAVEVRTASAVLLAVVLILLYPPILLGVMNALLVALRRTPILETPTYRSLLAVVTLYTANGLVIGLWAFFLFNALAPLEWRYYLVLTAACHLATVIGFVALFAPGGIGVREGILFVILPLFIARPTVIVGALLMRLISFTVELFLAGGATLIARRGGAARADSRKPHDMKTEYQVAFTTHSAVARKAMYDAQRRAGKAAKIAAVFRDHFGRLDDRSLLDVGASTGLITSVVGREFGRCAGIDIDAEAISHAARNDAPPQVRYLVGDGLNIPFADATFDAVICNQIYEHVPDPRRLIEEIHRVLAPGGVCYFGANNRLQLIEPHYGRLPLLSVIPKPLAHVYLRVLGRARYYYETHYTVWGLRRLVRRFEIIDYTRRIVADPVRFCATDMVRPGSAAQKCALAAIDWGYALFPGYVWLLRKPAAE